MTPGTVPVLIGRDGEVRALTEPIGQGTNAGQALLVIGDPGIGKSALLGAAQSASQLRPAHNTALRAAFGLAEGPRPELFQIALAAVNLLAAAVIAATQRPLAASTLNEPSGTPAWKIIPSWAVIGTADQVIPPAELTFMAKRAGAHITDVDAGHLSMISDPGAVTRVILRAARATS